jgi:hypothetical protein
MPHTRLHNDAPPCSLPDDCPDVRYVEGLSYEKAERHLQNKIINWRLEGFIRQLRVMLMHGERIIEDMAQAWSLHFNDCLHTIVPLYLLVSNPAVERLGSVGVMTVDTERGELAGVTPHDVMQKEIDRLRESHAAKMLRQTELVV